MREVKVDHNNDDNNNDSLPVQHFGLILVYYLGTLPSTLPSIPPKRTHSTEVNTVSFDIGTGFKE